eukprot:2397946-Prymnesium_polylepis.2
MCQLYRAASSAAPRSCAPHATQGPPLPLSNACQKGVAPPASQRSRRIEAPPLAHDVSRGRLPAAPA